MHVMVCQEGHLAAETTLYDGAEILEQHQLSYWLWDTRNIFLVPINIASLWKLQSRCQKTTGQMFLGPCPGHVLAKTTLPSLPYHTNHGKAGLQLGSQRSPWGNVESLSVCSSSCWMECKIQTLTFDLPESDTLTIYSTVTSNMNKGEVVQNPDPVPQEAGDLQGQATSRSNPLSSHPEEMVENLNDYCKI